MNYDLAVKWYNALQEIVWRAPNILHLCLLWEFTYAFCESYPLWQNKTKFILAFYLTLSRKPFLFFPWFLKVNLRSYSSCIPEQVCIRTGETDDET